MVDMVKLVVGCKLYENIKNKLSKISGLLDMEYVEREVGYIKIAHRKWWFNELSKVFKYLFSLLKRKYNDKKYPKKVWFYKVNNKNIYVPINDFQRLNIKRMSLERENNRAIKYEFDCLKFINEVYINEGKLIMCGHWRNIEKIELEDEVDVDCLVEDLFRFSDWDYKYFGDMNKYNEDKKMEDLKNKSWWNGGDEDEEEELLLSDPQKEIIIDYHEAIGEIQIKLDNWICG